MLTALFFVGCFILVAITCFVINYREKENNCNCIGDIIFEDYYEMDWADVIFWEPIVDEKPLVHNDMQKLIYLKY